MRGWHNLLRLVSTAYADPAEGGGFYQYPCLDDELLDRHSDGLICMSACFQSWAAHLIKSGDSVALRAYIRKMKQRYGDDFYIEIQPHDFDEQRILNIELARIAADEGIALVATNDTHFVFPEWAETQRVSKMMGVNLSFSKIENMEEKGEEPSYMAELLPNLYLCTRDEMVKWFGKHHPDLDPWCWNSAITNTVTLAHTIKPFLLDRAIKMPKVASVASDPEKVLDQWIGEGMSRIESEYPREHWDKWPWKSYKDRIEYARFSSRLFDIVSDRNICARSDPVGASVRAFSESRSQGYARYRHRCADRPSRRSQEIRH
jgi:DNA polymerase III alpha subunit